MGSIKRNQVRSLINRPDLLKQFGLIKQTDSILVSFVNGTDVWIKSVTNDKDLHFHLGQNRLKDNPATKYVNHNYNISFYPNENYVYFQFNRCNDKIDTYETMPDYLKSWIVPFAKMYLNKQIKNKNAAKTHGYVDVDRPVFKDYLQLMFDSISKQRIGNEFIKTYEKKHKVQPLKGQLYPDGLFNCDSLIFEKIENPKSPYYISNDRTVFKGKVIILANYGTGSAAALLTTLLQDNSISIVVGTSVGNNPVGATNYQPFRLPNSKFSGSVATGYLVRPNSKKGKIQIPDYWIENSVDDLIIGRDAYFEKAIELIKKK